MAKAYQKAGGGVEAFWCDNCEEWIEEYGNRTVLDMENCSSWTFGGTEYYEEGNAYSYEMYFCDSCYEPISLDNPPEMKTQGTWICGECKSFYQDQEEARDCCL